MTSSVPFSAYRGENIETNLNRGGKSGSSPVMEKQQKFAFQDRSNTVAKKVVSNAGRTPAKLGGTMTAVPVALWQENRAKKAVTKKAKNQNELSSSDSGESEDSINSVPIENKEEVDQDLSLSCDLEADIGDFSENDENDLPIPERMYLPLDADYDYHMTRPSPDDDIRDPMFHQNGLDYDGACIWNAFESPYTDEDFMRTVSPVDCVEMDYTFAFSDDSELVASSPGEGDVAFCDDSFM